MASVWTSTHEFVLHDRPDQGDSQLQPDKGARSPWFWRYARGQLRMDRRDATNVCGAPAGTRTIGSASHCSRAWPSSCTTADRPTWTRRDECEVLRRNLSWKQRVMLRLKFDEGWTDKQIAAVWGHRKQNAANYRHRMLAQMRKEAACSS